MLMYGKRTKLQVIEPIILFVIVDLHLIVHNVAHHSRVFMLLIEDCSPDRSPLKTILGFGGRKD